MATSDVQQIIQNALEIEEASWPEPNMSLINPEELNPPPFPVALFGSFWSTWITQAAESKSCPPDYVACGLLTSASALIGNAVWVQAWPEWEEPPILWMACVGKPSSGKSPGLDSSLSLVRSIQMEKLIDYRSKRPVYEKQLEIAKVSRKAWEQNVKKALDVGDEPPEMPLEAAEPKRASAPRIYTSDATTEAIVHRLIENPKGLLVTRDELAGWLAMMDKYGGSSGSERAFWLESYGGRAYAVDRVKNLDQTIVIPYTSLSVLGGIQPDRLNTLFLTGDDDGMCARFNFIWPDPIPPKRPVSIPDKQLALDALRKLDSFQLVNGNDEESEEPRILPLSEVARCRLDEFRTKNHQQQQVTEGLRCAYLGKQPGLVLRLSLIFELLWGCASQVYRPIVEVSEEAINAACQFVSEYLDPMNQRILGTCGLSKLSQQSMLVARWIQKGRVQMFNKREDLTRNRQFKLNSAEAQDVIEILIEAGWIRLVGGRLGGTPGRQKEDYEVNPQIYLLV